MKTLMIMLFSVISCCGQSFMTRMNVIEVLEDTTRCTNNVKVIWAIGNWEEMSFIWDNKILHFDKQLKKSTRKQKRRIKEILSEYNEKESRRKQDDRIKHRSLYLNRWNEVFFIMVYIDKGIKVRIKRIDGKYPYYFFEMVKTKT